MNTIAAIVLTALANSRHGYTRRTAQGLADETNLSLEQVEGVLNDNAHKPYVRKIERTVPAPQSAEFADTDTPETDTPAAAVEPRPPMYQFDARRFAFYQQLVTLPTRE